MDRDTALRLVKKAVIDRRNPAYYWSLNWQSELLAYTSCSHADFHFSMYLYFKDKTQPPIALRLIHVLDLAQGTAAPLLPDELAFETELLQILQQVDSGRTKVRLSQIK